MLEPPASLPPDRINGYLHEHWKIDARSVTYVPLGHGSHNWSVEAVDGTRWFVKADPAVADDTFLDTVHRTATALHEAGLDFVNAAVRSTDGTVRRQVDDRWVLAVLPFIAGRNPDFATSDRIAVAEALGRLHVHPLRPDPLLRWAPGYLRPELEGILDHGLDRTWRDGPYGSRARTLLMRHRAGIRALAVHHDRLVAELERHDDPWVITHGEPHEGNTFIDTTGRAHLIDSAFMLAPRERDLRLLLYGGHRAPRGLDNSAVVDAYRRTSGGSEARPFALELFRAEWHLIEIARYAGFFGREHAIDGDTEVKWNALEEYVPIGPNWPDLL